MKTHKSGYLLRVHSVNEWGEEDTSAEPSYLLGGDWAFTKDPLKAQLFSTQAAVREANKKIYYPRGKREIVSFQVTIGQKPIKALLPPKRKKKKKTKKRKKKKPWM